MCTCAHVFQKRSGCALIFQKRSGCALTSQIVKLLERLVQDQLLAHVQENNIISCDQHGFQQKCSCVSQLLECMNDWTQTYDLGESTDVIYLDFAKAFDTVAHQRLLAKMDHCGMDIMIIILIWPTTKEL